jgi:hypothetical protein
MAHLMMAEGLAPRSPKCRRPAQGCLARLISVTPLFLQPYLGATLDTRNAAKVRSLVLTDPTPLLWAFAGPFSWCADVHPWAARDKPDFGILLMPQASSRRTASHRWSSVSSRPSADDMSAIEKRHRSTEWRDRNGEGFRMPAITGLASGHGAGVRKPPMHEPAGLRRWSMGI